MENNKPLNLELLFLKKEHLRSIGQVTELAIFEPTGNNFNVDGLFSTEIFGRVGSEDRNAKLGYIDLKIPVLHPLIFKHIVSLKKLYKDIMYGKTFAKFDTKTKDFIVSNADEGSTGYAFFIKHFSKVKIEDRDSDARLFKIKLIKKYKMEELLIDKYLVLPAGLRDYIVDDNGKPSEDEVNEIYRKLLTAANLITNISTKSDEVDMLDPIRIKIQATIVEIYDHFIGLMDGKKKFIQNKWTKRAIRDSTRNVITPTISNITDLTKKDSNVNTKNTVIGLYQYVKALGAIAKHNITNKILINIFDQHSNNATLVDKESLRSVTVDIKPKTKNMWMSEEGLTGVINKLAQEEIRSEPVEIEDYYLCLIYDDGKNIKIVFNSNDLPNDKDEKYLRPMTYAELMYLSIYEDVKKYPGFLTRYPVANVGSINASIPYVKTTVKGRTVNILDISWEEKDKVVEYPKKNEMFMGSLSVAARTLDVLGADLKNFI